MVMISVLMSGANIVMGVLSLKALVLRDDERICERFAGEASV